MGREPLAWQQRAAVMAVALLIAEYGSVARTGLVAHRPGGAAPASTLLSLVAVAIAVGTIGLAVVLLVRLLRERRRRRRSDDPPEHVFEPPPISRWEKTFAVLVVIALLIAPIVLVIVIRHHLAPGQASPAAGRGVAPPTHATSPTHSNGSRSAGSPVGYIVLAVGLIAVAIAGWAWQRRRPTAVPDAPEPVTGPAEPALIRSVAAGARALRDIDEARAAIIACYAGMEAALAGAGTSRGPAETPVELLRRAGAAGLIRTGSARRLTGLFHEARYSRHRITEADRRSAAAALDELADDLRSRS